MFRHDDEINVQIKDKRALFFIQPPLKSIRETRLQKTKSLPLPSVAALLAVNSDLRRPRFPSPRTSEKHNYASNGAPFIVGNNGEGQRTPARHLFTGFMFIKINQWLSSARDVKSPLTIAEWVGTRRPSVLSWVVKGRESAQGMKPAQTQTGEQECSRLI